MNIHCTSYVELLHFLYDEWKYLFYMAGHTLLHYSIVIALSIENRENWKKMDWMGLFYVLLQLQNFVQSCRADNGPHVM